MPEIIRNFSLYVNAKKVGVAKGHTYTINSGNENQIGDGQWLGVTQGVTTTGLKSELIVPVRGTGTTLLDALLNKRYIQVGLGLVDGKIHKMDMAVQEAEYTTEMASGNLMGSFTFVGGEPKLAG